MSYGLMRCILAASPLLVLAFAACASAETGGTAGSYGGSSSTSSTGSTSTGTSTGNTTSTGSANTTSSTTSGGNMAGSCVQANFKIGCCNGSGAYDYCAAGASTVTETACAGDKVCGWDASEGYYSCVSPPGGADPNTMYPMACP
jgi:hypothetical protein